MRWWIIGITLFIVVGSRACGRTDRTDEEIQAILADMDGPGACMSILAILSSPNDAHFCPQGGCVVWNNTLHEYIVREAFRGNAPDIGATEIPGTLLGKCSTQGEYGRELSNRFYAELFYR